MDTQHILALLATPRVGQASVRYVLELAEGDNHPSIEDLRSLIGQARRDHPRIRVPDEASLAKGQERAKWILERAEQLQIRAVGFHDPAYPPQLRDLGKEAPLVLYTKGSLAALTAGVQVAVVGTRKPSPYGVHMGRSTGTQLANLGCVVVSGLAFGCDRAAHEGCLQGGGQTVAVLAHGLHMVYPAQNAQLARDIIAQDGCLVSEYPPGDPPRKSSFVERDRLQSGLSSAVVVIETDLFGGTMHTVRFAQEQHRILACVQHPPEHAGQRMAKGNQRLIESKQARPLGTLEDVAALVADLRARPRGLTPAPDHGTDATPSAVQVVTPPLFDLDAL